MSANKPTAPVEEASALLQGTVPSGLLGRRMGAHSRVLLVVGGGRTGWPLVGLW